MFDEAKRIWALTAITSAIEGVIRESAKGDALEVQRCYFKIKKETYKQSLNGNNTASMLEERALNSMKPEQSELYKQIVGRLSQKGGLLEEVNEWLKTNKPI